MTTGAASFEAMWAELAGIGRDNGAGGYHRFAWDRAELACREWFAGAAAARGMRVERDRNGNLWAHLGGALPGNAVVTGSHLDSVPAGGAFDGPLGIVSAFAALDALAARGWAPRRPVAVVAFAEEEGARFGVPCLGSRLLAGAVAPDRARGLRDAEGTTLGEAMRSAGADDAALGADPERLRRIGAYVELHVEQGRGLAGTPHAVALGAGIWPHGRWRLTFRGAGDHAGTTELSDRRDPMLPFAEAVLRARELAGLTGARATIGRVRVTPNSTNAIPAEVIAWLDARARDSGTVRGLVEDVAATARRRAAPGGVDVALDEESFSPAVDFDRDLTGRLADVLAGASDPGGGECAVPVLPTGAGHDAGVLAAAGVPAAMLFVRNPTGVSHAPAEHADAADCHAGVAALAAVLEDLAGASPLNPPAP